MDAVLKFIEIFKSESNEVLFTQSACYWFSVILHERFSGSYIVYDPHQVHFATMINGKVYDITGLVEDTDDYVDWEEYSEEAEDADLIKDNCIYLRGGEIG